MRAGPTTAGRGIPAVTATKAGSAAVPHKVDGLRHDPQPAADRNHPNSGFSCDGHH
jgi:hypothetical protein